MTGSSPSDNNSPEVVQNGAAEVHELSENYFERVNNEFRRSLLTGEISQTSITEITDRNGQLEHFGGVIEDAFQNSDAAFDWLKIKIALFAYNNIPDVFGLRSNIFRMFAPAWLEEQIQNYHSVQRATAEVLAIIENPAEKIDELLEDFLDLPESTFLGDIKIEDLTHSNFIANALQRLGDKGKVIAGLLALKEFLNANPNELQNIPTEPQARREYYQNLLQRLNYGDQADEIYKLISGELNLATFIRGALTNPSETPQTSTAVTAEPETPSTATTISEALSPEFDYDSQEYISRINLYDRYHELISKPNLTESEQTELNSLEFPYETSINEGVEYIETQYYVDRSRHSFEQISTTCADFMNRNRALMSSLGIATLIYGLRNNPFTTTAQQVLNIPSTMFTAVNAGIIPIGIFSLAMAGTYLYLKDNPMLPHDFSAAEEKITTGIKDKLKSQPWWPQIEAQVSNLEQFLTDAITTIFVPSKLNELLHDGLTVAAEYATSSIETVGLNDQELINQRNNSLLSILESTLTRNRLNPHLETDIDTYDNALTELRTFIQNNQKITPENLVLLKTILSKIGAEIIEPSFQGIYYWRLSDQLGPEQLVIDPTLSLEESVEVAERFRYVPGILPMLNEASENVTTDLRRILAEIIGEDPNNTSDETLINNLTSNGNYIQIIGNMVSVVTSAGIEYSLGTAELWTNTFTNLFSSESGGAQIAEFMSDYTDSLVPVTIIASPSLIRGIVQGKFLSSVVTNVILYPVTALKRSFNLLHSSFNLSRRIFSKEGRAAIYSQFLNSISPSERIAQAQMNLNRSPFRARANNPSLLRHEFRYNHFQNIRALSEFQVTLEQAIRTNPNQRWSDFLDSSNNSLPSDLKNLITQRANLSTIGSQTQAEEFLRIAREELDIMRRTSSLDLNRAWLRTLIDSEFAKANPRTSFLSDCAKIVGQSDPEIYRFLDTQGQVTSFRGLADHIDSLFQTHAPHLIEHDRIFVIGRLLRANPTHISGATTPQLPPLRDLPRHNVGRGLAGAAALGALAIGGTYLGSRFRENETTFEYGQTLTAESAETSEDLEFTVLNFGNDDEVLDTFPSQTVQSTPELGSTITTYDRELQSQLSTFTAQISDSGNIRNSSHERRTEILSELLRFHQSTLPRVQSFVAQNILSIYQSFNSPQNQGQTHRLATISDNFSLYGIKFDNEKQEVYLEYPSEGELNNFFWNLVDSYDGNWIDQAVSNERTASDGFQVTDGVDLAARIAPGTGTALDFTDSVHYLRQGRLGRSAASFGWGVLGGALDLGGFVTFGASTAAGSALRAIRTSGKLISTAGNLIQAGIGAFEASQNMFTQKIYFPRPTSTIDDEPSSPLIS